MTSTERKAFLQRRTSTAAERAAYRKARKEERKAQDAIDQKRINEAHGAWMQSQNLGSQ